METLDRQDKEVVVGNVRDKYASIAVEGGSCCGISGCGPGSEEAVTLDVERLSERLARALDAVGAAGVVLDLPAVPVASRASFRLSTASGIAFH